MTTRQGVFLAIAAAGALGAPADPAATSVPFGAHGDAVDGTSGQPVALTPTSILVQAEGPDGAAGTGDDETLLMTSLDATPTVTGISTPHSATYSSRVERLSATRAAMVSSGDDGAFGTADDALLVLDRLGSENVVRPVVVGGLSDNQQYTIERLASDRFVVPTLGADLVADTSDDDVVVVSLATEPPSVQHYSAPFQRNSGRTRIVAVSPTAFLLASDGPDKKPSNADDRVYLFRADGGSFARTDLSAPGLNRRAAGRCVRLSTTSALVVTAGPDFTDSTIDDRVLLLDTAAGTATPIDVPFAKNGAAGRPVVLSETAAVVATMGADGLEGTADDAVAVLSDLGGTNTVSTVVVGVTGDNNECRPARISGDTFALVTFGADSVVGSSDDEVTIVHHVGATPLVQHVVVGALAGGSASAVVPISQSALLVSGGGPDGSVGTSDDAVVVLTGIDSTLALAYVPLGGALDALDAFRYVPEVLGGGSAALLSSGADNDLGAGGDDAVRVIAGLGIGESLLVTRLDVKFRQHGATSDARVTVNGRLSLEDPTALLREDLTISVGNASQTIAAGAFASLREGRILQYRDAAGASGFVRNLKFDTKTGALTIEARGAYADLQATAPAYVPVALEIGSTLVPESVTARPRRNGFTYRRARAGG